MATPNRHILRRRVAARWAPSLLWLAVAEPAHGVSGPFYDLQLQPAIATPGEPVDVVGTFRDTLYVEPYVAVTHSGSTIRVVFFFADFSLPNPITRTWRLGAFPEGRYTVEYYAAPAVLPPGAPLNPMYLASDTMTVAAAFSVSLSRPTLFGLALALLSSAAYLLRLRRTREVRDRTEDQRPHRSPVGKQRTQ